MLTYATFTFIFFVIILKSNLNKKSIKKSIKKSKYKLKNLNQKGGIFNLDNVILTNNNDRFILSKKIIKSNKIIEIYDSLFNNRHLLLYDEDNKRYITFAELDQDKEL